MHVQVVALTFSCIGKTRFACHHKSTHNIYFPTFLQLCTLFKLSTLSKYRLVNGRSLYVIHTLGIRQGTSLRMNLVTAGRTAVGSQPTTKAAANYGLRK